MSRGLLVARDGSRTFGDLLSDICQRTSTRCLLVACCTKEYFLSQIADYGVINPNSSLLVATMRQMFVSEKIHVAFCPDLQIFRAYIAALPYSKIANNVEHIVVIDLLALHHSTLDFTVQGLSRTFATLASANGVLSAEMELVECSDEKSSSFKGYDLWNEHVPLLSGSIKISEAGQGWANLKTDIKSFAQRWIKFDDEIN